MAPAVQATGTGVAGLAVLIEQVREPTAGHGVARIGEHREDSGRPEHLSDEVIGRMEHDLLDGPAVRIMAPQPREVLVQAGLGHQRVELPTGRVGHLSRTVPPARETARPGVVGATRRKKGSESKLLAEAVVRHRSRSVRAEAGASDWVMGASAVDCTRRVTEAVRGGSANGISCDRRPPARSRVKSQKSKVQSLGSTPAPVRRGEGKKGRGPPPESESDRNSENLARRSCWPHSPIAPCLVTSDSPPQNPPNPIPEPRSMKR